MELDPPVIQALIIATTTSTNDLQVQTALLTGSFIVLGAAVSALATYLTMKHQQVAANKAASDQRLFDARRIAYGDAFSVISFSINERNNGRRYPERSTDPSNREANDLMARLSLLSSQEMSEPLRLMFGYLASLIPDTDEAKKQDMIQGTLLWQNLLYAMREDLHGDGTFLPNIVPTPEGETVRETEDSTVVTESSSRDTGH
ncbi:MAG TPA: hypothetical protein VGE53_00650 [Candidatus Paceibacterota bacterium]